MKKNYLEPQMEMCEIATQAIMNYSNEAPDETPHTNWAPRHNL